MEGKAGGARTEDGRGRGLRWRARPGAPGRRTAGGPTGPGLDLAEDVLRGGTSRAEEELPGKEAVKLKARPDLREWLAREGLRGWLQGRGCVPSSWRSRSSGGRGTFPKRTQTQTKRKACVRAPRPGPRPGPRLTPGRHLSPDGKASFSLSLQFLGAAPGTPLGAEAFFAPAPFQRPYSCPHCPYRANQKSDLKRHLLVHTGARPFACPHCPYRVNYRYDLKKCGPKCEGAALGAPEAGSPKEEGTAGAARERRRPDAKARPQSGRPAEGLDAGPSAPSGTAGDAEGVRPCARERSQAQQLNTPRQFSLPGRARAGRQPASRVDLESRTSRKSKSV
ncbi:zinc finger protein 219 [Penaeus vannamei]|uniref:zinc finger protein 219 n=1 Tax=Penaeus vannamei TaxID=6689 RepID=UPI00387F3E72